MKSSPHNIVVVICHDLGQHLGCYGAPGVRSPNIDAHAASGILFKRSFCTAPQCSPSRAALWTGRYAHSNGVVGLTHSGFANDLHPGERHFAAILRDAGYETSLFGVQHETPTPERLGYEHMQPGGLCDNVAGKFCDFLKARGKSSRPFFAQIGFIEPHRPFPHDDVERLPLESITIPHWLPDIPVVREDLADCEASVSSADKAFGRIVDAIRCSPIADNTILIFTADHGIPFTHAKMTLYDPGIVVPFIISIPGGPSGMVRNEMISNVDVVPTLLDLIGQPLPANLQGRSFAPLLTGGDYVPREAVFAEKTYHTYYDPMRAIRTDRWKLIANFEFAPWQETSPDYRNNGRSYVEVAEALKPSYDVMYHPPIELFDLEVDPHEQNNLADSPEHRSIRDGLIRRLRDWMHETQDPLLDGPMAQGAYVRRMAQFKAV